MTIQILKVVTAKYDIVEVHDYNVFLGDDNSVRNGNLNINERTHVAEKHNQSIKKFNKNFDFWYKSKIKKIT